MGDVRFREAFERVRRSPQPAAAVRLLADEDLVAALAGSSEAGDPYLANVLATEALNRVRPRLRADGADDDGARALEKAVRSVPLSQHLCLVYESQAQQLDAAAPFVARGLEDGEKCVYVVDELPVKMVTDSLRARGVDADAALRDGLTVLTTKDVYRGGGAFDVDRMIDFLGRNVQEALAAGYSGVRFTGEMTWALSDRDPSALLEYEAKLNRFYSTQLASGLCQYHRHRFPAETIVGVLYTHPRVVYGGLVCDNAYYVPPEEYLRTDRAEHEVTRLLRNVVEHETTERQLRSMNRELERRVDERTREMQAAYRGLEAFSYSVSHDLRAPLRGVEAVLAALAEDHGRRLDDAGRDLVRVAREEAARLSSLVEGLLVFARVGRGEMVREDVDVSAVAREVAEVVARQEDARSVEVRIQDGLRAHADAQLVRVVLDNLLRNAWKFTRDRPHARVELGSAAVDGASAFFVRDNGVGFDSASKDRLFEPFQRLHGRDFEGTGVGLATVRRVVERHGGRAWAEGEPGRGATFWFTLG